MNPKELPFKKNFFCFLLVYEFAIKNNVPKKQAILFASSSIDYAEYHKAGVEIANDVESGKTLAESLARFQLLFPLPYVKFLGLAQASGTDISTLINQLMEYDI
ncbi:hypothetical protein D3C80_1677400 [compost metagenome]